ncbi:hypothetical protein HAX54_040994 [Datura stramonium]|uniref:Uncharacterized protein n=1 Tax=Datura stramonium TaxID=4076 RepID=A0ABS8VR16_DATST|nr:hypothetical protein [Datura stramonium]
MAHLASENGPICINIDTDLLNREILEIDSTVLMSFLDEVPQIEYCDDEKLKSLIQSLEAELYYPAAPNLANYDLDTSEELVDDFSWMDMEMSSSTSPNSNNNQMIEFDQFGSDYSQFLTCIPIEEEVYDDSLWLQN